jgi:riboflavin kinase/FMN adenylyltransferase
MRIVRTLSDAPRQAKGSVVALGNFDGLHRGHQAVIKVACDAARAAGVASGVMTFEPHPRQFFNPDHEPFRLSPFRIKARLIEAMGVDYLFTQTFDREFSQRSADNFVREILVEGLNAAHVVVGYDYVFGHKRSGNVALLKEMAATHGFAVTAVSEMRDGGGPRFSSSNIRAALKEGRPADAARLLGRFWEIEGRVEPGDQRGRLLGFPTANLPHRDYIHPAKGVYAVRAGVDQGGQTVWHNGVANFGSRPTFNKTDVLLEVHLFDVSENLYGRHLRVALVEYIRPELKFGSLEALKAQIGQDSAKARDLLAAHRFSPGPAPYVPID